MNCSENYKVCTFGNPLLDIVLKSDDGTSLLQKYGLKPDAAVEADESQMPIFEEVKQFPVEYLPGGSSLNTSRVLQGLYGNERVVTFFGCIGLDANGTILKDKVEKDNVQACYMYDDCKPTGVTVAIVTGDYRSLCANIGAASCYRKSHLEHDYSTNYIQQAHILYVEGYFLTHSFDSALRLGELAVGSGQIFALNLSATYVCRHHNDSLSTLLPFVDILFGNEDEYVEFGRKLGPNEKLVTLEDVVKSIAVSFHRDARRTKISLEDQKPGSILMIVTRADQPILVNCDNVFMNIPVPKVPADKMVDTIGAGDAFVGGFLCRLVGEKPTLKECVQNGISAAAKIVQSPGCSLVNLTKLN